MDYQAKKTYKTCRCKQQTYIIMQAQALAAEILSPRSCTCERPQTSVCLTKAHHRLKKENKQNYFFICMNFPIFTPNQKKYKT